VSKKGTAKAKKAGTAKLTAKYKGKKYTCSVTVSAGKKTTLVVYFSATGTTKSAANKVKKAAGADILRLVPRTPYTSKDLDYDTDCRANREQNKPSTRPAIATGIKNLKQYTAVYLGYPIWWGKEPRVIRTFLDKYSMKGKTVIPFCTSGSSGISGSMSGIRAGSKGAVVKQGKDLTDLSYTKVKNWVKTFSKKKSSESAKKPAKTVEPTTPTEPKTELTTTEPVETTVFTTSAPETTVLTTSVPETTAEQTTEAVTTEPQTEKVETQPSTPETTEPVTQETTAEEVTEALTTEAVTEVVTTEPETTQPTTESASEKDDKTLIVYFSRTGNTKPLAQYAAEYFLADIFEIEAKVPYTDEDIAYYTNCRADKEQSDPTARPEISGYVESMDSYSTIVLAYPIWHGQAPKIIYTFLESYDFSGKTIIPFCTSASSPIGSSDTNLHPLAEKADWKEGKRFAIGTDKETLTQWLSGFKTGELKMTVNGSPVAVEWEDNESVKALKEAVKESPLTIDMSMYGGFEQVGSLGMTLPRNDVSITTASGDVVLYSGNQLVVFYGSNTWAYTRLGKITDKSESELTELLSNGNVKVEVSF
jgi:flavodoxin